MNTPILLEVFIKPNAKKTSINWDEASRKYVIWVKSTPQKGKANKEVLLVLKDFFKASEVNLLKGFTSTTKLLEIRGATEHLQELTKK